MTDVNPQLPLMPLSRITVPGDQRGSRKAHRNQTGTHFNTHHNTVIATQVFTVLPFRAERTRPATCCSGLPFTYRSQIENNNWTSTLTQEGQLRHRGPGGAKSTAIFPPPGRRTLVESFSARRAAQQTIPHLSLPRLPTIFQRHIYWKSMGSAKQADYLSDQIILRPLPGLLVFASIVRQS